MRTVAAVFPSRQEAEHVARHFKAIGIPTEEVVIAGPDEDRHDKKESEWSRRNLAATAASGWGWTLAWTIPLIAERTPVGATLVGAGLGAGAGLILGIGAAMARRVPILDGTSIAITLVAMAVTALFAGGAAATYASGVCHEGEAFCDEAIREHGVVVAAHVTEERETETVQLMNEHGARNTHADANGWLASGWKGKTMDIEPYPSDSTIVRHVAGE